MAQREREYQLRCIISSFCPVDIGRQLRIRHLDNKTYVGIIWFSIELCIIRGIICSITCFSIELCIICGRGAHQMERRLRRIISQLKIISIWFCIACIICGIIGLCLRFCIICGIISLFCIICGIITEVTPMEVAVRVATVGVQELCIICGIICGNISLFC